MKIIALFALSILSLHLFAAGIAAPSDELQKLVKTTQAMREAAEQEVSAEKINALYQQQMASFKKLESFPQLADEMRTLKRYSNALFHVRSDLDEYTRFRAYSTLVKRMIEDMKIFYPDHTDIALLHIDEQLAQLQTLRHCRQDLELDHAEYEGILAQCLTETEDLHWKLHGKTRPDLSSFDKKLERYLSRLQDNLVSDNASGTPDPEPLRHTIARLTDRPQMKL